MSADTRTYELVYVLPPELRDLELDNAHQEVLQVIDRNDGKIVFDNSWGVRKLAYPIDKKTEGHYTMLHIDLDPSKVADVERLLNLSENVMRYLIIRDPVA